MAGTLAAEFVSGAALAAGAATFAFVSIAAGAVSDGVSDTVWRTDTPPCNAGIEIRNATTMKTVAATIVSFDSTDAVPLGPKAVLEMLLVKSAPASVLPGCSKTVATRTMQATKKIAYNTYNNGLDHPLLQFGKAEHFV